MLGSYSLSYSSVLRMHNLLTPESSRVSPSARVSVWSRRIWACSIPHSWGSSSEPSARGPVPRVTRRTQHPLLQQPGLLLTPCQPALHSLAPSELPGQQEPGSAACSSVGAEGGEEPGTCLSKCSLPNPPRLQKLLRLCSLKSHRAAEQPDSSAQTQDSFPGKRSSQPRHRGPAIPTSPECRGSHPIITSPLIFAGMKG